MNSDLDPPHNIFKSPRYQASQGERNRRKELIASLEYTLNDERSEPGGWKVAVFHDEGKGISRDDIDPMVEAMEYFGSDAENFLLVLETIGGDPEVLQHWVELVRNNFRNFVVAVPRMAKSAGTVLCLASDEIWTGPGTEFGPIDPQIAISRSNYVPALAVLREYGIGEVVFEGFQGTSQFIQGVIGSPPPGFVSQCAQVVRQIRDVAIEFAFRHQLSHIENLSERILRSTDLICFLLRIDPGSQMYLHSNVIFPGELSDMGMDVAEFDFSSDLWRHVYQIYSQYHFDVRELPGRYIFETTEVIFTL